MFLLSRKKSWDLSVIEGYKEENRSSIENRRVFEVMDGCCVVALAWTCTFEKFANRMLRQNSV